MKDSITCKGTWPILKYTVKTQDEGYAIVMLDDETGTVLINTGNIALTHFWSESGRQTRTLREFLCKTSRSYIGDKLSYGLSRWSQVEVLKELEPLLNEKLDTTIWPEELKEAFQDLTASMSKDLFYVKLLDSPIMKLITFDELPSGEMYENEEVSHFLNTKWPLLIEYWKEELALDDAS